MLRKNIYMFLLYTNMLYGVPHAAELSFEEALQELHDSKPQLFEPQQEQPSAWISYENLSNAIDLAALGTALVRIYVRHNQLLFAKSDNNGVVNTILKKIFPESMQKLSCQTIWVKDSCIITLETISYRTVAKLVLYCSKGDVYDLIKKIIAKTKSILLG